MPRYLIGIDLGTTNSALAYIDLHKKTRKATPDIQTFAIPQLVAPGELANRPLLPSFLYLPGPNDLPAGSAGLPWDKERRFIVGEFARDHGAKIPGRLVTSAKSWLCHAGVDRSAGLLPWSAPPDVERISPVEASARFLRHLAESWNHFHAPANDGERLEKQIIVLTVPASFDDMARNLTVEAARQAGLENVILLEEPQAAFYSWLAEPSAHESAELKAGSLCLVVDIGGGTSDFSLIHAVAQEGELGFVRQAVGEHLLLGGDNMDLALAKAVECKLPGAGRLDAAQYGMLTQACRQAKETLLGSQGPASVSVTVLGRGRSVVGGALSASLTAQEVRQTLFEGFFPQTPFESDPQRGARLGLHEMGLPYVNDAAITRHLAGFIRKQAGLEKGQGPAAVLFNGGVFTPAALRERLIQVMGEWFGTPQRPWRPLILTNRSLDLAVAWGAAYFGWLRHSGGRRIGGGVARSYYMAVAAEDAQKDIKAPTLLCVIPRHLEEGKEIAFDRPELELALGQPVLFPLYTSTVRGEDHAGDIIQIAPDQLRKLPPLHTVLRGGKRSGMRKVPVTLAARATEIGTLELWCVAKEGGQRWRLEFNVRDIVADDAAAEDADSGAAAQSQSAGAVWPEAQIQSATELIREAYGQAASDQKARDLTKDLERALDTPRQDWPTGLCRRLAESLAEVENRRKASPAHLSRWYHLMGFCLRPGFGDPLDKYRIEQLWRTVNAPPRSESAKAMARIPESGADFWIMWRRVAGGLNAALQNSLFERLRSVLIPSKGRASARPSANELAEMWRSAASLERVDPKGKEALGEALLKQVRKSPAPTYAFWSLTRLGARVLFYGPLNAVIHPEMIHSWLDAIVGFEPAHESERLAWAFCLAGLARMSGQRALDVDDAHRKSVLAALGRFKVPAHWSTMVEQVTQLDRGEQSQLFGESLPIGLRLTGSSD